MAHPWTYSALPKRPASRWPNGARVAVWVAVGVESYRPNDGRTEDIVPAGPAPDLVNTAWRDYGNRVGAFRLFDRLSVLGIKPTLLLNTDLYDEAPEVLAAARTAGADIVAHGLSNSDALPDMSAEQERRYITSCRKRILAEEGAPPKGWSSPWLQHKPTTLTHLREAGFTTVLDFRLDDQPVWLATESGPILSVPYAAELNDSTTMIGRSTGAVDFAHMIIDEFEELSSARFDQAVVMSIVLHSFISGQPFRLKAITKALEHIKEAGAEVWFTTPANIYEAVAEDPDLAAGP